MSNVQSRRVPPDLRRRRLLLGTVGVVALGLAACAQNVTAPRIATHVWPGYEFLFLARQMGWLDERAATLIDYPSATDCLNALTRDEADGATLTLDEFLQARQRNADLKIVLVFNISAGADALLVRPEIGRLGDLAGRRIGVEQSAVGALMLVKVLEAAGLRPADVRTVHATIDEHERLFADGTVDAVITFEPVATQLESRGAIRRFDSRALPDLIVDVLVMRADALERHKAGLRQLVAAHFRALAHFHQNPQDAAYRLAPRLGLSPQNALTAYKGLKLPGLDDNRRLLGSEPAVLAVRARQLAAVMAQAGLLQAATDLRGFVAPDLLADGAGR